MGYSRWFYYAKKELYENGGGGTLVEISRKKPILANRVEPHIEQAVVDLADKQPAWEPLKNLQRTQRNKLLVSHKGVRSISFTQWFK